MLIRKIVFALLIIFCYSIFPGIIQAEMNVSAEKGDGFFKIRFPTVVDGRTVEVTLLKDEVPQKLELKSYVQTRDDKAKENPEGVTIIRKSGEMKVVVFPLPLDLSSTYAFRDSQTGKTVVYFSVDEKRLADSFKKYVDEFVAWAEDRRAVLEQSESLYVLPRQQVQENLLEGVIRMFKDGVLKKKAVIDQIYKNKIFVATADNRVSLYQYDERGKTMEAVAAFTSFHEYKQAPGGTVKSINWVSGVDLMNRYRGDSGVLINPYSNRQVTIWPDEISVEHGTVPGTILERME